jgi:glycogen operon protein
MIQNSAQRQEGAPYPLGVMWIADEQAYNFAIYSKHAERITLLIYSQDEVSYPIVTYDMDYRWNKTGSIWHCRLPISRMAGAAFYGYRVDGPPAQPGLQFHWFDSAKILLDPYAVAVHLPGGFSRDAACRPGSNVGQAPLGVLPPCEPTAEWVERRPRHAEGELIIYELHVRGFTQRANSGVRAERRGTFLGVIDKIPYLLELGVTAVELMPIFQFDPQGDDYWGYMPLSFFSPHTGYAVDRRGCGPREEFRAMVQALHGAGIEVILDVVYNHSCEGDHRGPVYSFKGIDNTTYYFLTGDRERPFANFSGTGNTLHTANRAVRRLIIDSLHYWDQMVHIDGFRFDLASIFVRGPDGSLNESYPSLTSEIDSHTDLVDNRLIAEPWDSAEAYLLGQKFPGQCWMQWNGAYRDTLQRFVRGDAGMVADLMTRLYGSTDFFPDDLEHACRPSQSINYVTSHDGSTLYDLVSYQQKRNWANGHRNTDGANEYRSNQGWEGDERVPTDIMRQRLQQVKNFCALLMLSNGTPMFRMGDEFLQTQGGNNNPYNQDNEISWLDWDRRSQFPEIFRFFRLMIALRKNHPAIGRSHFWRDDVSWFGTGHDVDMSYYSHQLAFHLSGASQADANFYVMINAGTQAVEFTIQKETSGGWRRVVDTSLASPEDIVDLAGAPRLAAGGYQVSAHSVVVLMAMNQAQKG